MGESTTIPMMGMRQRHDEDECDERHGSSLRGMSAPSRDVAYHASMASVSSRSCPARNEPGTAQRLTPAPVACCRADTGARAFAIWPSSISCRLFRCCTILRSMSFIPEQSLVLGALHRARQRGIDLGRAAPKAVVARLERATESCKARTASSGSWERTSFGSSARPARADRASSS